MTIDTVLTRARLQELAALDRLRRALVLSATDPDWMYVLAAMDARAQALRELLAQTDPGVVAAAEDELQHAANDPVTPAPLVAVDVPINSRVH
jgi:hypothetical protein